MAHHLALSFPPAMNFLKYSQAFPAHLSEDRRRLTEEASAPDGADSMFDSLNLCSGFVSHIDDGFDYSALFSPTDWPWETFPQPDARVDPESNTETLTGQKSSQIGDCIRRHWHTFVATPQVEISEPDLDAEKTQVDETFRLDLNQRLHPSVPAGEIPSTEFLVGRYVTPQPRFPIVDQRYKNASIRAYFNHVNPIFPILHTGTFRLSKKNSLLLMSMSTMGSLFLGSSIAVSKGRKIFHMLAKAALVSVCDMTCCDSSVEFHANLEYSGRDICCMG